MPFCFDSRRPALRLARNTTAGPPAAPPGAGAPRATTQRSRLIHADGQDTVYGCNCSGIASPVVVPRLYCTVTGARAAAGRPGAGFKLALPPYTLTGRLGPS